MKKTVRIEIDESEFPMLFKIDKQELGNICFDIFKNGYCLKFPDVDKTDSNMVIKSMIHYTDSLKSDIREIDRKIDTTDIDEKLDQFSEILEQLFGITNNSSKKGKVTEDIMFMMLRTKFKDFAVEETRGVVHSGDAIIHIPKDKTTVKVMIEIKNYIGTVDTEEIEKLRYDMRYNKIKYSIFVSIKSGFVGKKNMAIEEFKYDSDIYTILYIPNLFDDLNKMEAAIILIDKLIDYHNEKKKEFVNLKWLENSIVSHLTKLDVLYTEYNKLKNSYFKMEKNVKQAISDHYIMVASYENILKQKINDTWSSINKEFGDAERELIARQKSDIIDRLKLNPTNKNLVTIIQILMKHNLYVQESGVPRLWHILKILDDSICGTILKTSKDIQISFQNPKVKFDIDVKKKIDDDIMLLDNMLSY